MELRETFDTEADRYDRARPGYPPELFDDLATLAGLKPGARVLEIGPGTGQATRALLGRGYHVTAIESGTQLAAKLRLSVAGQDCRVHVARFEDWQPHADPFDAVFAATMFHWIEPRIRLEKSASLLRPGGALAVVATDHVAGGTEEFFVRAQECYERHMPDTEPGLRLAPAGSFGHAHWGISADLRFASAEFRRYVSEIEYSTADYLDVISTYSNHIALDDGHRRGLLSCIGGLIDREFGGGVRKAYLRRMTVARLRPQLSA